METLVQTSWSVDPMHSEVQFKVKHLVISTVTGQFLDYSASLETQGENFDGAKASFEAKIDSITTNQADRDAHLKSADFFDAENFPTLKFESEQFKSLGGERYEISGNITLRGISKPLTLQAEFGGLMTDPYGQRKAGFDLTGKINRKDFGLNWSAVTEAGGIVVSDEVKLALSLQFVKK